ncbi:MAG: PQQ-binding-like beta-propeller repeat protein [bacterium]|nr:PQQ-binding-like beta-propeller repeat protein [bacterium]
MRSRLFRLTRFVCLLLTAPAISVAVPQIAAASSWPGLRGPSHDGAVRDVRLFEGESAALSVAWQRELGSGYPVVAVDGERLVTGFQSGAKDVIAAFDSESGDELWRYEMGEGYAGHTGSHDGPIATPVLAGGRVFGLGPRGHLFALDAATGASVWTKNLADDLEAEAPFYGFGASPVVVGATLVVQLGAGEGKSIGGFDVASGELLWSTGDDTVEYNTPIVATLGGRSQVVAAGTKHLRGLDPSSGAVLWSHEHGGDERAMGGATIIPVPAGENRLLLLNQQPESSMLEVSAQGGAWQVSEVWKSQAIKGTYVQPVYHDGYLYGMNGKIFTCVDAATGAIQWRSREPGDGFPTLVGDHLVIMTKPGVLRVADASPEGYKELASVALFDQVSWSAPAFAGGHLYLRSMSSLARVDPVGEPAAVAEVSPAMSSTRFAGLLADLGERGSAEEKSARIDAFLAASSVPVIEDTGAVHFLYRGEAEDVGIVGDMVGFRREDPMTRVPGTDLFYYSTRLEPDAAVHYGFLVDYGEPTADPLNPNEGEGLFGEVSFVAMPAYRAPDFSEAAADDRRGRLEEISWESEAMEGQTRKATVYLPAGYDADGDTRYPTLYVHDGQEALEKGHFKNVLDHLAGDSIAPVIVVFVTPADPENSRREFRNPAYVEMFGKELVSLIDERYLTLNHAMARASAGTGSGADFSFRVAFEAPDQFARVGAIWPTLFAFGSEPPRAEDHPLVIYQRWGSYHLRSPHENFDSAASNREFQQRLRDLGHRPAGGEVPEGVGWNNFRGYVDDMLRALFPLG